MRSSARSLVALAAFAALLTSPATGSANDPCRAGCFRQTRHCVADLARAALFTCKLECTGGSRLDLPTCIRGCAATFRTDRATCREQRASCAEVCDGSQNDPAHDAACVGACGTDLAACGQGVADQGRQCIVGCANFPGQLAIDCLYVCVDTAKTDALACGSDFRGCVQGCATTPTTARP
jgi:hypothetical protein